MIAAALLRRMWPRAPQSLVDAVAEKSAAVFAKEGLTTRRRVVHFMAQVSHESGGGTITAENLSYSTPERIAAVWPRRFTPASARAYVHNPKGLAEKVYNGRMGNRPGTSDGYDYRGRGLLQITGRESYREIGALTGLPLEESPELAYAPSVALEVAVAEFKHLGCLPWCDKDNIEAVTKRVNGGYTGLASRKAWLARWKAALPDVADTPEPAPAPQEEPEEEPPPVEIPRGSDETLPPGVDHPDKDMSQSKTGWAAVLGTLTVIATTIGNLIEQVKPILADPTVLIALAVLGVGAGVFVWLDRRNRMRQDRV